MHERCRPGQRRPTGKGDVRDQAVHANAAPWFEHAQCFGEQRLSPGDGQFGVVSSFKLHFIDRTVGMRDARPAGGIVSKVRPMDGVGGGIGTRGHAVPVAAEARVIEVFFERIDLPQVAVGIGHPEFRLPGVAALDPFFALCANAVHFEALLDGDQRLGTGDTKPDVIEGTAAAAISRVQRENQRRIVDFELHVIFEASSPVRHRRASGRTPRRGPDRRRSVRYEISRRSR